MDAFQRIRSRILQCLPSHLGESAASPGSVTGALVDSISLAVGEELDRVGRLYGVERRAGGRHLWDPSASSEKEREPHPQPSATEVPAEPKDAGVRRWGPPRRSS